MTSPRVAGTLDQLLQSFQQPFWIGPSQATLRAWCEQKGAEALAKWEQRGDKLLAEKSPWWNGADVSFTIQWKDGILTGGSAEVELLPGKTVQVSSMQEIIQGAAYGT